MTDAVATLQRSLVEAGQVLTNGEAVEAERRAKAITALVRAEREVAEFATTTSSPDDDDDLFCIMQSWRRWPAALMRF